MTRRMVLLALLLFVGAVETGASPRAAGACSGPGPAWAMLDAPMIVEGRVTAVRRLGSGEGESEIPIDLSIEVTRSHRGANVGDTLRVTVQVPNRTLPLPCPRALLPADLVGETVLIVRPLDGGEALPEFSVLAGTGTSEGDRQFAELVKFAALSTDSDPAAPRMRLSPESPVCGETFRATGERIPPGRYALKPGWSSRVLAVANVGPSGTFSLTTKLTGQLCALPSENQFVDSMYLLDASTAGDEDNITELAPFVITGGAERTPMELVITPERPACGDPVTFEGRGFEPGESLRIEFLVSRESVRLKAGADGTFGGSAILPAEECLAPLRDGTAWGELLVMRDDLDLVGPQWALLQLSFMPQQAGAASPPASGAVAPEAGGAAPTPSSVESPVEQPEPRYLLVDLPGPVLAATIAGGIALVMIAGGAGWWIRRKSAG
jgi:hypothetical protein